MLFTRTWILDCAPHREEIYNRLNRFREHCSRLGIPNPYSLNDIYRADDRWKKLHKNAVPPFVQFLQSRDRKAAFIDENKRVKQTAYVGNVPRDDGNWGF